MKKLFVFMILATVVLGLMGTALQAQTLVNQWGRTVRGNVWPITNTSSTTDGNASMGRGPLTGWASISGGFSTIQLNAGETIVVSGKLQWVGGDPGAAYTGIRYALSYQDSPTLNYRNTDSANWSSANLHYGYQFTPRSGGVDIANGTNGSGMVWTLNNVAGWNSTYNAGITPLITVLQAPRLATLVAGPYNWAMSVTVNADGTNLVKWYLVDQNNKYWFGGSVVDTKQITTKFNFVSFGTNNDINAAITGFTLTGVTVQKGTPITIPEAPWQAFYVDKWGATARGSAWPIKNDTTYLVGDGMMGTKALTGWASISGGFGETITATTDKAIIVTGQIEWVGADPGAAYTGLRYALSWQDSVKLNNQYKDSALWVSIPTTAKGHYGYQFTPRSGGVDIANGTNGSGMVWTLKNVAGWNSTYNADITPLVTVLQAPRLATLVKGPYNFAISVRPLADGTNEVRWYLMDLNNKYWFGGTVIDKNAISSKFNFISFGTNNDINSAVTGFKVTAVKVDKGSPITVPAAPWQAYYIDQWGFIGSRMYGWNFMPDPAGVVGNAGIGSTVPNQKWAAIRGGFETVTPTTTKAMVLTGKVEFVGGGYTAPGTFRFGTFYSDQAGKIILDSAKATLPDSTRWDGLETYTSGYLFVPPSSANGTMTWAGLSQPATSGAVINGAWLHNDYPATGWTSNYTLGTDVQTPANAAITAGIYDFAVTVYAKSATSNDVRWKLSKGTSYSVTGKLTDTHAPLAATKFNSINFAISGNAASTAMKLTDVKVDYVDIATVPIASAGVGVTDVEKTGSTVPTEFALSQNYPNPFNPSTTIRYDIAKLSHVRISVYDVLGRNIATLVDGMQTPSQYVIHWSPAGQSSGTYFYRIDAQSQDGTGNFSAVKKLVYMK
jgi:hypothetical protein